MKKRDLFVILGIVLIAAILIAVNLISSQSAELLPSDASASAPAEQSQGTPSDTSRYSEQVVDMTNEYFAQNPAESYLVVTTANNTYSPIPLNEDNEFRITQKDGSENVIHIGKNSFYMKSSNCDNQNCVEEGEVTLENRSTRLLLNFVYCLPHNLSLEMLSPDEAKARLLSLYAEQDAKTAEIEQYMKEHPETTGPISQGD